MTVPADPATWMVVLSFSMGVSVSVAPSGAPQGYAAERTCRADIAAIRRAWSQIGLPEPNAVVCKRLKVK